MVTQVKGTLVRDICGSLGGAQVLADMPLVPLTETGDARFSADFLTLPAACSEPDIAFLVRVPAGR